MEERIEIIVGYRIENRSIISNNEYYKFDHYKKQPHVKMFIERMKVQVYNKLQEIIYSDPEDIMNKFEVIIQKVLIDE